MKRGLLFILPVILNFLFLHGSFSQTPSENLYAVTTFECAGIYWKVTDGGPCRIRFKEESGKEWKDGLDLVYDARDGEYRGSIIGLSPDTGYQVELSNNNSKTRLTFKTRSDRFPVGKITVLPEGESDTTIVITESGTPRAYHLVTVPSDSKSVINLKNAHKYGIEINADYVIIRGVEIRNASVHGVIIRKNRHDIVIEQCYIAFWGRIGGPKTYGNLEGGSDSGIFAEAGTRKSYDPEESYRRSPGSIKRLGDRPS